MSSVEILNLKVVMTRVRDQTVEILTMIKIATIQLQDYQEIEATIEIIETIAVIAEMVVEINQL